MATARINISMGVGSDYQVELSYPETNGEAWGKNKAHIDALLDLAVEKIKRAYNEAGGTSD